MKCTGEVGLQLCDVSTNRFLFGNQDTQIRCTEGQQVQQRTFGLNCLAYVMQRWMSGRSQTRSMDTSAWLCRSTIRRAMAQSTTCTHTHASRGQRFQVQLDFTRLIRNCLNYIRGIIYRTGQIFLNKSSVLYQGRHECQHSTVIFNHWYYICKYQNIGYFAKVSLLKQMQDLAPIHWLQT